MLIHAHIVYSVSTLLLQAIDTPLLDIFRNARPRIRSPMRLSNVSPPEFMDMSRVASLCIDRIASALLHSGRKTVPNTCTLRTIDMTYLRSGLLIRVHYVPLLSIWALLGKIRSNNLRVGVLWRFESRVEHISWTVPIGNRSSGSRKHLVGTHVKP